MSALSQAAESATSATSPEAAPLAWIYASFADGLGGGNPAGVVLTSMPLAEEAAQAIAAVLSVPTTGFVVVPSDERGVADVRFFTPEQEIEACGHVTVAVATALVERGIWRWGDEVIVRARGGEFALTLRDRLVAMTQRLAFLGRAPVSWPKVRAALGSLEPHPSLRLARAGTGLRHLVVPVADASQLAALELDATRIAGLAREAGLDTICVASSPATRRSSAGGRASSWPGHSRPGARMGARSSMPPTVPAKPAGFDHLIGRRLPSLRLDSTQGRALLSSLAERRLVLFIYRHATGLPEPPVPEWDSIPGARGCTAQSCGFRDQHPRLTELGAEVAGLSVQTVQEQQAFAERVGLKYRLISDPARALQAALGLPTFTAGGRSFYRRLTLVAESGVIVKVFDPIAAPAENAAEIVRWLESRDGEGGRTGGEQR